MNARKIFLWLFGAATVAVVALTGIACFTAVALGPPRGLDQQIQEQQRELLYHTDHAAILSACRQFMREHKLSKDGVSFDGSDPRLPAVIRQLHPTRLTAANDHIFIGFGGGFIDEYGFTAYAPASKQETQDDGSQGIRLLPGLWYTGGQNGIPATLNQN